MSTLNELIQPKRENSSSVVNKMRDDIYYVDPQFQRKLIWTEPNKVKLIETILIGYPMPEIYLWAQKPDAESGIQKFSIVDGQQRLTTISQFIKGEWAIKKSALHKSNQDCDFAGKSWDELETEDKQKIWEYNLDIREIPSSVNMETIHKIFVRLNQTDKSLNPQEMRNAEFHGKFIKASVELADELNSYDWNIFTDKDIRRMKDIDFSSQLLTLFIQGIGSTTTKVLNDIYDRYNDKYSSKNKHLKKAGEIFDKIEKLFENEQVAEFFQKPVHFYTLFAVIDLAEHEELEVEVGKLESFVTEYTSTDFDEDGVDKIFAEYKRGSSYTTTGKAGRERRAFSLLDYLKD